MQKSTARRDGGPGEGRWELLRDLLKFELKLLMDGLRDLLMSPLALVAAIAGLLFEPQHPRRQFERALQFGRRTEAWINLFDHARLSEDAGVDELFGQLEARLLEHFRQGGLTSSTKRAVDASLDRLQQAVEAVRRRAGGEDPAPARQTTEDAED